MFELFETISLKSCSFLNRFKDTDKHINFRTCGYALNHANKTFQQIVGFNVTHLYLQATMIDNEPNKAKLIANCACHDVVKISYKPT